MTYMTLYRLKVIDYTIGTDYRMQRHWIETIINIEHITAIDVHPIQDGVSIMDRKVSEAVVVHLLGGLSYRIDDNQWYDLRRRINM